MRVCTACATSTDESGRFCPTCGAVLVEQVVVDGAAETSQLDREDVGSLAETARKSLVGKTIDGFAIESILGGGAFGTVYRGRQLGLDRPVAIKVPTQEIAADPVMARRFAREARSAAKITHPGVVAIYAVGELADGRPYLAMQLIDGDPLDRILETGPVPARRALGIARLIASALSETHAANVVHRDLKPSNIIWRRDRNGDDRITIVDFGIAIAKPGNADATRLTTNGVIGTPHYMSPEQAQGDVVDHRADLYALGCIMFELLTGKPPFDGSGFEVLLAHIGRPIPAPSERNPDVPEVVDRLVMHLMGKKVDDRPRTADEVVELIDEAAASLDGPGRSAGATVRAPRAKRKSAAPTLQHEKPVTAQRSRGRWIALGVLGVLALSGAGFAALKLSRHSGAAMAGADAAPDDDVDPDPTAPSPFTGRRTVVVDDGEMSMRVTLYDPIVAGTRTRTALEIWNAIGAPLDVDHVVVTIEDPQGGASGLTATPSKKTKGKYAFRYIFPAPGHYVVRVFPPEVSTVFLVDVDVAAK
jgi:serine/threonine-protein kinase